MTTAVFSVISFGSDKWVNEVIGRDRRHAPRDGHFDFYSRELSCILAELPPTQYLNTPSWSKTWTR